MQSDKMQWKKFMTLFTQHNGLWKGPTAEVSDGVQQTFWEEQSSIQLCPQLQ